MAKVLGSVCQYNMSLNVRLRNLNDVFRSAPEAWAGMDAAARRTFVLSCPKIRGLLSRCSGSWPLSHGRFFWAMSKGSSNFGFRGAGGSCFTYSLCNSYISATWERGRGTRERRV